jgi:excisionase family DNA binding protein
MVMQETWETAKDVAAFLKVSLPEIRKLTRMGMPHLKIGRAVRFDRQAVLAYLRERQAQTERNGNKKE